MSARMALLYIVGAALLPAVIIAALFSVVAAKARERIGA